MSIQDDISKLAVENYSSSDPWPNDDLWHTHTCLSETKIVEQWLTDKTTNKMIILNAGSGGKEYNISGTFVHLDIIESYIKQYENYIVGSVEKINIADQTIDGIICVGSVLNYADAQRALSEFSRILKPGGFFIIEFERSNSAEFLATSNHGKSLFLKEYHYNGQTHKLWLYSEKQMRELLKYYGLKIKRCKRIHILSSLLNRLGLSETRSAPFSTLDNIFQVISYPLAHNVLLFGTKEFASKGY